MRKKISLALLLASILHFSCAPLYNVKINVELPGVVTLNLDQFREVVISDFLVEKTTKDFDINQELADLFSLELSQHFSGKVTSKDISWGEKDVFQKKDFWKNLLTDPKEALILTGSVRYSEEIRKAILEDYSEGREGIYLKEKGIAQRKFYTLILHLYLIKAETGEILYERDFKESRGYKNPKQTANFAFYDLMEMVRGKFVRNVLGEKKLEQRHLIFE